MNKVEYNVRAHRRVPKRRARLFFPPSHLHLSLSLSFSNEKRHEVGVRLRNARARGASASEGKVEEMEGSAKCGEEECGIRPAVGPDGRIGGRGKRTESSVEAGRKAFETDYHNRAS